MPASPAPRYALLLSTLFGGVGITMPFLPPYLAAKGLSPEAVGLVLFLGSATRLAVAPPLGALADRMPDPRGMLSLGALLGAGAALLWLPAQGLAALMALQILWSLCMAPLGPLAEAMTLVASRAGLLDFGRVRAIGSVAFILGSIAGGLVAERAGYGAVPLLLCATMAASAAAAWLLPAAMRAGRPVRTGLAGLLSLPGLRRLLLVSALINGSHAALYGFSSIHWARAGHDTAAIGLLWGLSVAAEVAMFWFGRRVLLRLDPRRLFLAAAVAGVLRWSVLAATTALPALAAAQLLHALTFGAYHLAAMHLLSQMVPPNRAAAAQTLHASLGAGGALALLTLACGPLYAAMGGGMFLVMAGLCLAALPLAWTLKPDR
ncbi:MFS transporter [Roseomonas sp. OT10]|uniref:MFS transporter n=1 Tax=Roseomonas cutis TaxID=2897332 RepID=UPI001E2D28C9|nr:MFS transporter [Roseomonas sp. OT10]UFN50395.1 MFS transporter [Roseomonas sp. OT10]